MIAQALPQKTAIASGGFDDEVQCSHSTVDVEALRSTHKEADTICFMCHTSKWEG